ncbi:MAG: nucleotidyltransferase domain-containing protein [Candidatus Methylomirabilales bacterium]
MPRSSPRSAGATYLDKAERIVQLKAAARRAAERLCTVCRVVLFGSFVSGIPTPRSDADLLVVVETSPHLQPRDRVPEVLRALGPLPCPIDLFVVTDEELRRLSREGDTLVRLALETGQELLQPEA